MEHDYTYIPPPPPDEHHSYVYTFKLTSAERISIIDALQQGLKYRNDHPDTVFKVTHTRKLLEAFGVKPCR